MKRLLNRLRNIGRSAGRTAFTLDDPRYSNFDIGIGTYGSPEVVFYDAGANLRIGKYCAIAPRVTILLGGEHHYDWVSNYPFSLQYEGAKEFSGYPFSKGDVNIGNDVWIGYSSLILSGVTIGDGAVIAAGSVVTKDVEPYAIVGGVPAKLIRSRFPGDQIQQLQMIEWWHWPESKIRENWSLLQSGDVGAFIKVYADEGSSAPG